VSAGEGRPGSIGHANRMNARYRYEAQKAEVTRSRAFRQRLFLQMQEHGREHSIDFAKTMAGQLQPDGTQPNAEMLRMHASWLGATMVRDEALKKLKFLLRMLLASLGRLPRASCPASNSLLQTAGTSPSAGEVDLSVPLMDHQNGVCWASLIATARDRSANHSVSSLVQLHASEVAIPPPSGYCKLGNVFCPAVHFEDEAMRNASNERFWRHFVANKGQWVVAPSDQQAIKADAPPPSIGSVVGIPPGANLLLETDEKSRSTLRGDSDPLAASLGFDNIGGFNRLV